jgi:hypothetical protein
LVARQRASDLAGTGHLLGSPLSMNDFDPSPSDAARPTGLRLVWSNPCPPAPRRMNLDAAIEHHLLGRDGLSDEAFLRAYAGARRS